MEYRDGRAALSFYYSDSNSKIPIRDVSNKNDPKPDPNLETGTFGLFSICHNPMRKSIVTKGIELLLFCTNRRSGRVLTGYYRIGWYYEVKKGDFMLAAKEIRFVHPGFPLIELSPYLQGYRIDKRFRGWKYLTVYTSNRLLQLLDQTPDATSQYISEIRRLEQSTLAKYGVMYRNRSTGFSWESAASPMGL